MTDLKLAVGECYEKVEHLLTACIYAAASSWGPGFDSGLLQVKFQSPSYISLTCNLVSLNFYIKKAARQTVIFKFNISSSLYTLPYLNNV